MRKKETLHFVDASWFRELGSGSHTPFLAASLGHLVIREVILLPTDSGSHLWG